MANAGSAKITAHEITCPDVSAQRKRPEDVGGATWPVQEPSEGAPNSGARFFCDRQKIPAEGNQTASQAKEASTNNDAVAKLAGIDSTFFRDAVAGF